MLGTSLFRPGPYCTSIQPNSPLENASTRKGALALLKGKYAAEAIPLCIHSIKLSWEQRRVYGEDVSTQMAYSKPGPVPDTVFIHVSVLATFWKSVSSGPRLFTGGYRRWHHWETRDFTTLEELQRHPVFIPGQPLPPKKRVSKRARSDSASPDVDDGKHYHMMTLTTVPSVFITICVFSVLLLYYCVLIPFIRYCGSDASAHNPQASSL